MIDMKSIDANDLMSKMLKGIFSPYTLIKNAPAIDPESLRSVSEWELNPHRFSCEHFRCKKCHHIDCAADKYCGECGAKMTNAGVKPEDLPIPEEELPKSSSGSCDFEEVELQ